jgi:hypothetical protein
MLGILIEKAWCADKVTENLKEGTPRWLRYAEEAEGWRLLTACIE